jgi:hypothetical protein
MILDAAETVLGTCFEKTVYGDPKKRRKMVAKTSTRKKKRYSNTDHMRRC